MPYATARTDGSGTAVMTSTRADIANWLFSQTKTTGSFQIAARFIDSWRMPWFSAPSPKKQTDDPAVPEQLRREPGARRDPHAAADDAVGAEDALLDVGDVHAAALAAGVAGLLPQQLGHHHAHVAALGDAVAVAAMGAGDRVVLAEGGADADGDRLLADVGVGGAAHDAFAVQLVRPVLEGANLGHAPEHLEHLFAREADHLGGDSHAILPRGQWQGPRRPPSGRRGRRSSIWRHGTRPDSQRPTARQHRNQLPRTPYPSPRAGRRGSGDEADLRSARIGWPIRLE